MKFADLLYLIFFFGIVLLLARECVKDETHMDADLERRCNSSAADSLSGGTAVDVMLERHAQCLKGDR